MRALGSIVGLLLIIGGVFFGLGGCVLSGIHPVGGSLFWIGVAMIIFGWALSHLSNTKECPTCKETVKFNALKCKHCGSELGAPRPAPEPLYK